MNRKKSIGAQLEAADGVLEVNYVSADDAWSQFQEEYFGDNAELRKGSRADNPLRIPITMKYICQMCPSSLT